MHIDYSNLISIENIFQAWNEFRKGKSKRIDVQEFERNLEDNLFELHQRLASQGLSLRSCKGIPLGNLTSQVFANIYLNELDQFVKHNLKAKYYIRYADDFIFLAEDKGNLLHYINVLKKFLAKELELSLHPKKIIFRKLEWGIDFLGYIVLPHYILPRTKTKKRAFKKLKEKVGSENFNQSSQSYLGYLKHANSYRLTEKLKNQVWLWLGNEKVLFPEGIYAGNA